MATPTPMRQALSQQGRTPAATSAAGATPPVSTPYSTSHAAHMALSPHGGSFSGSGSGTGARSSPQNIKRSPAYVGTLMGRTASNGGGSNNGGSGGGGGGGGGALNYDSPATAAVMGALGFGLGLDGGGLDGVSVSGLTPMGGGGLGVLGARNDDEERARRLHAVQALLGRGRTGATGDIDGPRVSLGGSLGGSKTRTLIIAGSALALELVMANNLVTAVTVTFPETHTIALRHAERANTLLLADLQLRPTESPLTKSLDAFAANLEQLAVLDRLSVQAPPTAPPAVGLNLYEAVAGIYETLDKLYRWDLHQLGTTDEQVALLDEAADPAMTSPDVARLALDVQCTRHGRPALHAHGRLGLTLTYWQQHWLVRPRHSTDGVSPLETTYGLRISCVPMGGGGALVYQPVRVSNQWLSDAIVRDSGSDDPTTTAGSPDLDWLDPDNTLLPPPADDDAADPKPGGGERKLPDVKFVAVFDPPVVVAYSAWHEIYDIVGLVPEDNAYASFDVLSLPGGGGGGGSSSTNGNAGAPPRTIRCTKEVAAGGPGTPPQRHEHTLFVYKPVLGRTLAALPFAHPSQLVRMLPILRQYAFLATLLERAFDAQPADALDAVETSSVSRTSTTTVLDTTLDDAFAAFLDQRPSADDTTPPPVSVDVALTAHPTPRLQVAFPLIGGGTADIHLEIGLNGRVQVLAQNVLPEGETEGNDGSGPVKTENGARRLRPQDLGRMLEVCEDLGLWSEWIRHRCTSL